MTQVAEDMERSEDVEYRNIECNSYEELFRFIRAEVLDTPDVVTLNSLTQKLTQLMQSNGLVCVRESTKKHIRRKVESEFGSSIHIFPDDKGKLIVVPDSMTISDIAKLYQATKQELAVWKIK